MKGVNGIAFLGIAVIILAGVFVANSMGFLGAVVGPAPPPPAEVCDSTTSPNLLCAVRT